MLWRRPELAWRENRMASDRALTPAEVLERLHRRMNDHDLQGFLGCFAQDYRSEQPAHPDRAFGGRAQVEENWGAIFRDVGDFQADLIRSVVDGDSVWAEWNWYGTRADATPLVMRGVTVFGVGDGCIRWGRLYMELVEESGAGIGEAVKRMTAGAQGEPGSA
jgi:ketosteroid isomerase-like protein